jgi:anti-sigma regulatory factor (Ser/Thr protein kinase)
MHARTTLPAGVDTPAAARAFIRDAVHVNAGAVEDLTLVVSELVTTAVVLGSPAIEVAVAIDEGHIFVEVADGPLPQGSDLATVSPIADDSTDRGLMLVSRLAARWGIRRDGARKVLWADLATT